jgi:integrase
MKVTLRKKGISKGMVSLYLDFYPPILHPDTGAFTRREFLGLYIHKKSRNEIETNHNKETLVLAQAVCARRQLDIQNENFGFISSAKRQGSLFDYFQIEVDKRKGSNYFNWDMGLRYFKHFAGPDLRFVDLNLTLCEEYKKYLLSAHGIGKKEGPLSHNTAVSYFAKLKAILKKCYKDKLLTEDLNAIVEPIKEKEVHIEFLEIDELQKLINTPVDDQFHKNVCLTSALTGLRFCDVEMLTWGEVRGVDGNHFLQFTQVKTDGVEVMPISDQVFALFGNRLENDDLVFPGLSYYKVSLFLSKWISAAGINKKFSYNCLRHTCATLQIDSGIDIYTVSKMLGHRHVKTTQRYAKVVDRKKKEAAKSIKVEIPAVINRTLRLVQ